MLTAADFEKALRLKPCAKSVHFFVHHLPATALSQSLLRPPHCAELSTGDPGVQNVAQGQASGHAVVLGMVVPKRHAKRSATRSLLKRHIRATFSEQLQRAGFRGGGWVVRLRLPIDRAKFCSAQSLALASSMREELTGLMKRAGAACDPA